MKYIPLRIFSTNMRDYVSASANVKYLPLRIFSTNTRSAWRCFRTPENRRVQGPVGKLPTSGLMEAYHYTQLSSALGVFKTIKTRRSTLIQGNSPTANHAPKARSQKPGYKRITAHAVKDSRTQILQLRFARQKAGHRSRTIKTNTKKQLWQEHQYQG